MVSKRSIIAYWLLLLVPTMLIGVAAFRLLSHEQERMAQQYRSSALERLHTTSEAIQLAVVTVEESMTEALAKIQSPALPDTLSEWKRINPLVRNVFIWSPREGLKLPEAQSATMEERQFAIRYDALFSGRFPWETPRADSDSPKVASPANRQWFSSPVELRKLARLDTSQMSPSVSQEPAQSRLQGGWIPWFSENDLSLLGWIRQGPQELYYGVEIEMMSLLSRVVADMPREVPRGIVYALVDGNGQLIHQCGSGNLENGKKPDLSVPLAPYLPHWQVSAYFTGGSFATQPDKSFFILAGLLLAIFLAAIILGGSMLLWQAHRNMTESMQKTSFVSNVSHELKTPLTNIRMYAELLSSDRIREPEKRRNYLSVIVSESERLTRLVNNVLDFSRLEQGRKKYWKENLDISQCIHDVLETQRLRLQEKGIELELNLPQEPVFMEMDRDALEQVLLNLIDNAIKYGCGPSSTEKQEITGEITVVLRPDGNRVELCVMDRGPGVPAAHAERIFDKFHRVDDSLTTPQPGSGLGLSISRRLLRDLGGDLIYQVREGGGSCFVARLK